MSRIFIAVFCSLLSFAWMEPALAAREGCDRPKLTAPVAVSQPAATDVTVATQNLWRLFDDVKDGGQVLTTEQYDLKRTKLARQIAEVLHLPDVVAVQEVENRRVLAGLATEVARLSGRPAYQSLVLEGMDPGGIDVGFLVRANWKVLAVKQLLTDKRLDSHPLFDRPPLHIVLQDLSGQRLELVNVHLKSLKGSEHPGKVKKIASKRRLQAQALAGWWRQYVRSYPRVALLMLGDFNATPEVLGGVDVLGELHAAGLVMTSDRLPAEQRYTYVYQCRPELIDNILASPGMVARIRALEASRGNADRHRRVSKEGDTAAGSSDHDALVLYLQR